MTVTPWGYQMTKCAEEKPYFWVPELLIDPLKCLLISCRSVLALSFASFRTACGAFQDHYHNDCRVQCHNAMAWPPLVPDFQMRGIPLWTATLVIRPGFGNSRKGNLFHMSCVTIGLRLLRVTVEHRHTRPVGLPRAPVGPPGAGDVCPCSGMPLLILHPPTAANGR